MTVEKTFKIRHDEWNNIEKFYKRVASFMEKQYSSDIEKAIIAIKSAMAFDWSLCDNIGIQTNIYRDTIYVGR